MNDINDTARFITNADDFSNPGTMPTIAITAKYPLAPPCPTDEYKKAITAKANNKPIK
jgi:hypothetical protein